MKNKIVFLILLISCFSFIPAACAQSSQIEIPMHHIFVTPFGDQVEIEELIVFKNVGNLSFNGTLNPVPFDGWHNLEASTFTGEIKPGESLQMMISYSIDTPSGHINLTRTSAYDTGMMNMLVPLRGGVTLLDKGSFETASGRTLEDGEYYVLESYNLPEGSTIRASFTISPETEKPDEDDHNYGMIILIFALIMIAVFPNLRDYLRK